MHRFSYFLFLFNINHYFDVLVSIFCLIDLVLESFIIDINFVSDQERRALVTKVPCSIVLSKIS